MKRDPITRKNQAHLIHLLHASGEFTGHRGGRLVNLRIKRDLLGSAVAYKVFIGRKVHCGETNTVADAVEVLNRLISHSSAG